MLAVGSVARSCQRRVKILSVVFFLRSAPALVTGVRLSHFFDSWFVESAEKKVEDGGTFSVDKNHLQAAQQKLWGHGENNDPSILDTASINPCIEADVQAKQLSKLLIQEKRIQDTYAQVLAECKAPDAGYHPDCVAQLESDQVREAKSPVVWLANCSEKMKQQVKSPSAASSSYNNAGMCLYAEKKVARYTNYVAGFSEIADLMKQSAANCNAAPLQCIRGLPLCLDPSVIGGITYCFKKCLQTGGYDFVEVGESKENKVSLLTAFATKKHMLHRYFEVLAAGRGKGRSRVEVEEKRKAVRLLNPRRGL
ncbi:unnamed protein product [Amoebophrya sp. A120]|nr:unnamed protein product [Amoebophrya sp. A120]|eukprot:GSA120T00006283001.1